ncbi:MAG TPA: type VI secretion system baseplate subunit TssK [Sedimentisphaerales bacterium]|jgi:type VI secretion system ImpJ/VasE family protein|nr:type VI secretion system baseplate subunit TssK [Sedimentisphaerales bacterium]
MAIEGEIHWREGLFLQPHHLQIMQRNIQERFARQSRLTWSYPYGLIEARISDDQLENMRVSFDRLRAMMPSGLEVNVPDNAHLPSLDIKQAFASSGGALTISLGVPVWYRSRGNVVEKGDDQDWRAKRTYRVAEVEKTDENTGDNPQPVLVRQINARLLLDQDDRSDLEVLPLLRIIHGVGEDVGLPRRDAAYIPPCFVVGGSSVLRELLVDLANQVMASRNELVVQINRGGFSIENMRGVQFEQMLRLRTLNRFSAQLGPLIAVPGRVAPFQMYLMLRELLGELAALRPDRDQFEVAAYDHDSPAVAFNELSTRIRGLLKGVVRAKYLKIALTLDHEEKIFAGTLTEEALSLPNEYFLAIRTKQDPSELARLVLDRDKFKLMPHSLANQRVFGMQLAQELYPPVELPAQVGLHYFRVVRAESARLWDRIQQERAIAVRWPGVETSDFEITLYMTVPDTEAR